MSLILDALRKLEREKAARDPGVLVVGSVPWGGTSRTRRIALVAAGGAALALAAFAGWLLRPSTPAPATGVPNAPLPTPEPRVAATPTPPLPTQPATALRGEVWVAPPIQLSRPLPAPTPRVTPANATKLQAPPDEAPAAPPTSTPAMQLTGTAVAPTPQPESASPESISIAPAAAGSDAAALPAAPADGLRLTAISQRDGRPVALINDRLLFEGDSFDGVRVLRIGDAEVELEVRGQRRLLRF